MADSDKDLKIGITTTADLAGAKATEAAIKSVGTAANEAARATSGAAHDSNRAIESMGEAGKKAGEETASSSKEASKHVKELGHDFHAGAQAGRILAEVAEGNIGALAHLGSAIKTIGVLLKTNLIGTLFTLGALAAQVILPMVHGFKSVEEATKKAAEEADKLAKTRMDTLTRELGVAAQATDELTKEFERALNAKERLDNAEQAALLAELRNNTSLTEVEKAKKESAIKEDFRQRANARKIEAAKDKIDVDKVSLGFANEAGLQPQRNLEEALQTRNEVFDLKALFEEQRKIALRPGQELGEDPERDTRFFEIKKEIGNRKEPIKAQLDKAAKDLEDAQETSKKSREAIAEANRQVRISKAGLEHEQSSQGKENALVGRERASDLGAALKGAQSKDNEHADTIRAAREKLESNDQAKTHLDAELKGLEDQLQARPGLSNDPRNSDLVAAISKKKAEIESVGGQRAALEESYRSASKDAPKSILARSQQAALDGQTRDAIASRENTAAIKELIASNKALPGAIANALAGVSIGGKSTAAPGTFTVDGQVHQLDTGAGGGKITRSDGTSVPVAPYPTLKIHGQDAPEVAAEKGGVKYSLDKVTGALVKQGAAIKDFGEAAVSELSAQAKAADRNSRQIANLR